jgi:iron(II)-dependent oxidoreductase
VTSPETLGQLSGIQQLVRALAETLTDAEYRTQYHPDLSPLGWHLGHVAFVESYWLQEKVQEDDTITGPLHGFFFPERIPKPERGPRLPPKNEMLHWVDVQHSDNLMFLANLRRAESEHPLLTDEYLPKFLTQHACQHYETMLMVLTQKALAGSYPDYRPESRLEPAPPSRASQPMPAGHFRIGGDAPEAYDNELPRQKADLGPFSIAPYPVSNAEYVGFMESGAYKDPSLWSESGWYWLNKTGVEHPEHWRQDDRGWWYGVGVNGPYELGADAPVAGINHFEANAFAAWAGARLPHEYQWEAACRMGLLEATGRVWEWCENAFHPYEGFKAFPYDGYSKPWFDGKHYTLKGGSLFTRPQIKRPSFRNFYEADKRHIFAGLRLVF